jgi:hypothetical protein
VFRREKLARKVDQKHSVSRSADTIVSRGQLFKRISRSALHAAVVFLVGACV